MKKSAHWRLTVSGETDKRVRRVLEALGRRGDLSQFVEEAVNARLLELGADKKPRSTIVEEGSAATRVDSEQSTTGSG